MASPRASRTRSGLRQGRVAASHAPKELHSRLPRLVTNHGAARPCRLRQNGYDVPLCSPLFCCVVHPNASSPLRKFRTIMAWRRCCLAARMDGRLSDRPSKYGFTPRGADLGLCEAHTTLASTPCCCDRKGSQPRSRNSFTLVSWDVRLC